MLWNGYRYKTENGNAVILQYSGSETDVKIPAEIGGCPVTEIGREAFAVNGELIERIEVPSSVRKIGEGAFKTCLSLTELVLHDGLEEIGAGSLFVVPLRELFIPATVRLIGDPQELGEIPWSVDERNPYYFTDSYGLYHRAEGGQELVVVQKNDEREEYRVLDGTVRIGEGCFGGHSGIRRLILPDSLRVIGEDAFESCQELEEISLPEGLEEIGDDAFSYCVKLGGVRLPASLRVLGDKALTNTFGWSEKVNGIRHISVAEENPYFRADESALFQKEDSSREEAGGEKFPVDQRKKGNGEDKIQGAEAGPAPEKAADTGMANSKAPGKERLEPDENMPACGAEREDRPEFDKNTPAGGTQKKENCAPEILLKYFGSERAYAVPDSVSVIGWSAFRRCGLHRVTIPVSVRRIEDKAFLECRSLEWIRIEADGADLYVPQTPVYRKSEVTELLYTKNCRFRGRPARERRDPARGRQGGGNASGAGRSSWLYAFSDEREAGGNPGDSIAAAGREAQRREEADARPVFDYAGYDSLFETYFTLPDKCRMAACRLKTPVFLPVETEEQYRLYLQENLSEILMDIHEKGDLDFLSDLAELGFFTDENIGDCIEKMTAVRGGRVTEFLLNYKRENLSGPGFDFSL